MFSWFRAFVGVLAVLSGVPASAPLDADGKAYVSPGPYGKALRASWMFYDAQRSGSLRGNRVAWRNDTFLADRTPSGKCLVGGHFDAGDNVFFGLPYAWTASTLAFGMNEFRVGHHRSGQLLRAYDVLRSMTDYIAACYVSDDEIVVGAGDPDADHAQWQRPEDAPPGVSRAMYAVSKTSPGADVAAGMAAALAAASVTFDRVDPRYSELLLETALKLYAHASRHPGIYSDSVPAAAKFYKSSGYLDELAWAAAWLAVRTGNDEYSKASERYLEQYVANGAPWKLPSWDNGYHYALLLAARNNPRLRANVSGITDAWMRGTDGIVYTPGGLAWSFEWGSLRHTANGAFFALAHANADYVDAGARKDIACWAKRQLDYMLGLGAGRRSFVVGFGDDPPCRPHHRAASCPAAGPCGWDAFNSPSCNPHVLTGALVGGPGKDDSYADDRKDYVKNEVALDYNSGFSSALAGLLHLRPDCANI